MTEIDIGGYAGKLLRVNLTNRHINTEKVCGATLRKYLGGTGIGIKFLYDEVPPEVECFDPENRLILASGPLGGTRIGGSGSFSVVTKGPLTNGAASVQANGFFGAYLKFSGFDGIIIQGRSKRWKYLHINDNTAELHDASHLIGKDTYETEALIKQELGKKQSQMSVASIGPAGENLVKFAGIFADRGHSASHNGVGSVMGSKGLKAIAVARAKNPVLVKDRKKLSIVAKEMRENVKKSVVYKSGTIGYFRSYVEMGLVPVKNYTTNIWSIEEEKLVNFNVDHIREYFKAKRSPCWACPMHHCSLMTIPEGPYAGRIVEEPEYEQIAALGPNIGVTDVSAVVMLSNEVDRLGMDVNEAGWVISWVMECYEKGIITKGDINGLEMAWGNSEAARRMIQMIAKREEFGDVLAEGVMRAAQVVGGKAPNLAIYTKKGNTPRSHDHRTRWCEMFDTCVSNTSTIETNLLTVGMRQFYQMGEPMEISTETAKTKGLMQLEDSLVTCRFNSRMDVKLISEALCAVTGWNFTQEEANTVGLRIVNLLRVFNLRHGLTNDLEYPSSRYGSTPANGPAKGKSPTTHWNQMLENYYCLMGWDERTGKPLPETLKKLDLEHVLKDNW